MLFIMFFLLLLSNYSIYGSSKSFKIHVLIIAQDPVDEEFKLLFRSDEKNTCWTDFSLQGTNNTILIINNMLALQTNGIISQKITNKNLRNSFQITNDVFFVILIPFIKENIFIKGTKKISTDKNFLWIPLIDNIHSARTSFGSYIKKTQTITTIDSNLVPHNDYIWSPLLLSDIMIIESITVGDTTYTLPEYFKNSNRKIPFTPQQDIKKSIRYSLEEYSKKKWGDIDKNNSIWFYNSTEPYYQFTNFALYPIFYNQRLWLTSEHCFQAAKFADNQIIAQRICLANTPRDALNIAKKNSSSIIENWHKEKKFKQMSAIVYHKFLQYPNRLGLSLKNTGNKILVEDTTEDNEWGAGSDKTGNNYLGRILMMVRDTLYPSINPADALSLFTYQLFHLQQSTLNRHT